MADYELGPCQILLNAVDMGKTEGGVTISVGETTVVLNTDQDGETPVDEVVTGTTVTITGNLAEITLANIASVLKGSVVTNGAKEKVEVTPNVGTSLLSNSNEIIVKPYVDGSPSTEENDWITMGAAGLKAAMALNYNKSDQRVIAFEAVGYPHGASDVIATFGDTTAA